MLKCTRCRKEKDEKEFETDGKIYKNCNLCRENNRKNKLKNKNDPEKVNTKKENNKLWKEKNKERTRLYNQHYNDLKNGIESDWNKILEENGLEKDNIKDKPSPHRKPHYKNEIEIEGKDCSACKSWKSLEKYCKSKDSWDHLRTTCNDCLSEYRKKNKDHMTEYNKKYWIKTMDKQKEKSKLWREKNKEYIRLKRKEYRKLYGKEIDKKQWQKRKNNTIYKIKFRLCRNKREKEKRKNDPNFKLKQNVSRRIRDVLFNQCLIKTNKTIKYVACSIQELKDHLESTFQESMSWLNYGSSDLGGKSWQIDHIIPCSSFDLTDNKQLKACFHYTNLQALWKEDNMIKSDKYSIDEKEMYMKKIDELLFSFENLKVT